MANVARSPFYVPRPSDDPSWQWVWPGSGIMLTLSAQKFFGVGGQVPTKRWSPIYTFDDPGVWYEPTFQNGPVRVTGTQTKFFGQNGQVVTHNWAQNYTLDDPSTWMGSPISSDIIHPLLTAAGQVKSKQWLFGLDDPAVTYQWTSRNSIVLKPTGNPIATYTWRFNTDDPALWQPTAENLNSATIQILSFGGQPHTKQPSFVNDDASAWYFTTYRNQPILVPSGTPTTSRQPAFATDDQPAWQWTPPNTIANQLVSFTFPSLNVPEGDDSTPWSWSALPRPLTLATPTIAPFIPRQWLFGLSTDEPWKQTTPKAQPLSILAFIPFSPRFIPTLDDATVWTNGLRPVSLTLTVVPPSPLTSSQWHFDFGYGYDDVAVWNAQSRNAFFTQTQPVSFKSAMWNLNIPQDTPSPISSTPSAALYLPAPVAATLIQRTLTGVGL